ncbi:DUF3427 domain-containing protein [Lactobacillus sp. PV037]|uniref:DEAD/DEAH box helicase n=1 Tax=unclassified Lactobacillus TaxID=2620435 RepID=UPI002240842F|nr:MULTISPECIES: DEAD/DEAH box helicase [unclassified Lactobacillus]QNQ81642.1 DUF3427 domain-containing protein [Lactobacillus sp. PV012]QNQ84311.1 DUF3427 domain-containing protein [Lactobacillus sp. PV037]
MGQKDELLLNTNKQNIWTRIKEELKAASSFTWVVAFISENMLTPLKVILEDLAENNVTGTLITGSYLNFNSPKVFEELQKIPNLTVKIAQEDGFHAKGYLFDHPNRQTIIIGSANFTRSALLKNYEWSLKVDSLENEVLTQQLKQEILNLSQTSIPLTTKWLKEYARNWQPIKQVALSKHTEKITPNAMQQAALEKLTELMKQKKNKALIVSATGTGKTYLGAFAVKKFQPQKFLYLVHRQQIAEKSLTSFEKVLDETKEKFGIFSGTSHDLSKKYTFATVQSMSQDEILAKIPPETYDYILIDEAHRTAAPSYQKIMRHFKPKFWLGMTATPERMDEQNIFEIFDYNLAFEIRLADALKQGMLTPFHYVGVQDYEANDEVITETSNLRKLTSEARVNYLLKEIQYYGYSGEKARGLVFCSKLDEAAELAKLFTQNGHPAFALTNADSNKRRQEVVNQLKSGAIEYIFTVDLFNEGIDIPELNQIIMLRNTQSSIVFLQQLGRGLRKYPKKDFVTVIDFIGNYKNNYLIPMTFNEKAQLDKDRLRNKVRFPETIDVSTINFTQIASQKILNSLAKIKLDSIANLRQQYLEVKNRLGRVPYLQDLYQVQPSLPMLYANNKLLNHYGDFLQKMGEEVLLTDWQNQVLTFLTKELLNGKRIHELLLLKMLLKNKMVELAEFKAELKKAPAYYNEEILSSIIHILSLNFFDVKQGKTTKKQQYGNQSLIEFSKNNFSLNKELNASLKNPEFKKLFQDVVETGLLLSKDYHQTQQFTLYQKYSRKDVCRLLNWPKDVSAPMYGYRVDEKETPIFVTYQKQDETKRNAVYKNNLSDGKRLRWYTRSPRHLNSPEVDKLLNTPNMKIHVFIKESDAWGKQFSYLGQATIDRETIKEEVIGPKKKSVVGMDLLLATPLTESKKEEVLGEN